MTLEQKILRLEEIKNLLVEKKVSLTDSIPLIEEAFTLKKEIEEELKKIELKLADLTSYDNQT